VVYLLVRREWRAAVWTGVFSLVFIALTLVDVGWQPFLAFREHFSGLLSGEAFPAFRNPSAVAINLSVPGIVFKLKLFGASSMGFGAARVVGTLYMLVALVATVLLARRDPPEGQAPLIWLTVLLLATLRSPFLPWSYGTFPALWLLTLMVASHVPKRWALAPLVLCLLALGLMLPVDSGLDPRVKALISGVPQMLMIALAIIGVRIQSANVDRHEARQMPEFAT
jgi:alpha-1,2-mannosyltransferase